MMGVWLLSFSSTGGVSLPSKVGSSNGPDEQDIIQALSHFEEQNKCRIIVTIRSCGLTEAAGIWYEAKAISRPSAGVVPVLLASVQLSCGSLNAQTTAQAIFNLLYQLDFEIAAMEWRRIKPKS